MTTTVTGSYETDTAIKNTREDLISIGVPQEQIFIDAEHHQIKVMIADSGEPEIEEILRRHNPSGISKYHH